MKNYTIPFFIPHRGCTHKCVFCDQVRIAGEPVPDPEDIPRKIERYLSTMPKKDIFVQVGFFGGSFTGISLKEQEEYLAPVRPFLEDGRIGGIRLSTRPDLIDQRTLTFLEGLGVSCIELGVQSMSEDVLEVSKRGHTCADTVRASAMITDAGFELAHQMMLGLPLSTYDKELHTAVRISELGARQVRIYPLIVMDGTELAGMWRRGEYEPLDMEEAVERAGSIISFFMSRGIKVIRCGLHATEGLLSGQEYLAGPFHPAFGHFARERAKHVEG